jgi:hypothetical protein
MPRGRAVANGALALVSLVLHGPAARAQTETATRAVSFDSEAALKQLRRAQRDFERVRESNAPTLRFAPPSHCDLRFGAYCNRFGGPDEDALPEPAATDRARSELLDQLEDGARLLPGDPWIAGQRVRYLVEHGRPEAAAAAARECRAEQWWCTALAAFVLHAQEDDAGADTLFAEALAAMPAAERCSWTNLTPLLGDNAGSYSKLPCEAREGRNLRLWWLGRPLYLRPGNDLRVEHYARHVMARIMTGDGLDRPVNVDGNLAELIVRYGWPVTWLRAPRRSGDLEPGNLITRARTPAWSFFPSASQPPVWQLDSSSAASVYSPTWATSFSTIDHVQIARFRRGDSVVTVAGFDLSTDTVLAGLTPRVALAVGSDAASPTMLSPALRSLYGAVAVQSPDPPTLVSLEAIREEAKWAGRFRSATADAATWFTSPLSDILLVRAEAASSGMPDALTSVTLPGTVLPGGRPVGIYWEWYERPPAGTVLAIEARVAKIGGKGRPDPLGRSACAPPEKAAMAVQWREPVTERRTGVGRAVALDLTRLEPGRYLIAISVGVEGVSDPPRCTSREIQLAGR